MSSRGPGLRAAALSIIAIAFLSPVAFAVPATLLSDSFDDGNRSGWFGSSGTSSNYTLDNDAGTLTIKPGYHLVTYFDTTTLAVGDSLTVTMHLSFNDPLSYTNGFRMALYDSHGTENRVTADGHLTSNDLFKPYTGYRADMNFTAYNGTTTAIGIQHRNPADATHPGSSLLHTNTSMYYQNVGSGGLSATPANGELYTGIFTITRLENGTKISVSIVGTGLANYSYEIVDANGYSTFDTFAILPSTASSMASLTLHDVTITYAAAIPELAATTAALGMLTASFAAIVLALRHRQP